MLCVCAHARAYTIDNTQRHQTCNDGCCHGYHVQGGDQTGWLEDNGWVCSEGFRGDANRKVMEQQMPKLLNDFKSNRIDKVRVNCLLIEMNHCVA